MVEVVVIPDGAAEDSAARPSSLERSRTPVLDEICCMGRVSSVKATPNGLIPGSEVGIPTVLGVSLHSAPSRGLVEAAAYGIEVPESMRAWRVDLPRNYAPAAVPDGLVHLRGHRYLFIGVTAPRLEAPWRVWPGGAGLPRVFDSSTVFVCARGAAAGCGSVLGARVVVPEGSTGGVDTDYEAKARASLGMLDEAERIVVHVGAPDEAAHDGDPAAKVAALDAVDNFILRPLWAAARTRNLRIVVCPDHGTDPRTGRHLNIPVPRVEWHPGIASSGPRRLVERKIFERARK